MNGIIITAIICGTFILKKVLDGLFADRVEAAKQKRLDAFVDKCADRIEKWEKEV